MDATLLTMALIGYEAQRQKIQDKITEIERQLNGRIRRTGAALSPLPRTRRRLSAAARKRIAAAQKKRWAEFRKKKTA